MVDSHRVIQGRRKEVAISYASITWIRFYGSAALLRNPLSLCPAF